MENQIEVIETIPAPTNTDMTSISLTVEAKINLIIMDILERCISRSKCGEHEFRRALKIFKPTVDFEELRNPESFNLLHLIVRHNRLDLPVVLFHRGLWKKLFADVTDNIQFKGLTALEMSQKLNFKKMYKEIIKINNIEDFMTPLNIAVRAGNEKTVKSMLQHMGDTLADYKALYFAAVGGDLAIFERLVAAGCDIDYYKGSIKVNVLAQATYFNHDHLIPVLVTEHGFNPNQSIICDGYNVTMLQIAAKNGHMESFRALIKAGAILEEDILLSACLSEQATFLVKLMKEFDLDINAPDRNGRTAIHVAVLHGKYSNFRKLVRHNASIWATDIHSRNIIHYACKGGNELILEQILNLVESKNLIGPMMGSQHLYIGAESVFPLCGLTTSGKEAWQFVHVHRPLLGRFLSVASRGGQINVTKLGNIINSGWGLKPPEEEIRKLRATFNVSDNGKKDLTPLMVAILSRKYNIVPILLKYHPFIDEYLSTRDAFGYSTVEQACMMGHLTTIKLLLNLNVNLNFTKFNNVLSHVDITKCIKIARENGHHTCTLGKFLQKLKYVQEVHKLENRLRIFARNHNCADKMALRHIHKDDCKRYILGSLREISDDITHFMRTSTYAYYA